jgi:hypothetical protein
MKMIDESIIGKRFGKLVVISFHHSNKYKMTYWLCKCDCGNEKVISRGGLTSGDNVSCGCYHKEHAHEYGKTHGLSRTKLYSVWSGMIQRCTNAKAQNYDRYGARGISVCDEWRNDFKSFYDWAIGSGYSYGLTIDRIDTNGNYEPSNCRWADRVTQQNNRRKNHNFTYCGVTHTVAEWSRILNVNHETLRYRIIHNNLKDFESLPYSELITYNKDDEING